MTRTLKTLSLCLALLPLTACPRQVNHDVVAPVDPESLPELVEFSSDISKPSLEADQPQQVFARLRAKGKKPPGARRPSVNLALALDVSGSMEGEALADAKAAATVMVEKLKTGDRLAIVTFGGESEVVFGSQPLTPETRTQAKAAIDAIEARGTTDLATGLNYALSQAAVAPAPDGVNRVVLLSDGVPNDPAGIPELADHAKSQNITITSLGLGLEFDETLLTVLAQRSGGRYHYIEDSKDAVAVFDKELLHMQRTVARNLALNLKAGPGVRIEEVVGYPQGDYRQAGIFLGDLADGQDREVVVRLTVGPHHEGSHAELLDARWDFQQEAMGTSIAQKENDYLSADVGGELDAEAQAAALEVEVDAHKAIAAAAIVQVAAMSREGRVQEAKDLLARAIEATHKANETYADTELGELLEEMTHLRDTWPSQPAIAIDAGQGGGGQGGGMVGPGGPGGEMQPTPSAAPGQPVPGQPQPKAMRDSHAKALDVLQ